MKSFGDNTFDSKITLGEDSKRQSNILDNILEFKKDREKDTFETVNAPYQGRELVLNAFESRIFWLKPTQEQEIEIQTPKEIFKRLAIVFVQVKAIHKCIY